MQSVIQWRRISRTIRETVSPSSTPSRKQPEQPEVELTHVRKPHGPDEREDSSLEGHKGRLYHGSDGSGEQDREDKPHHTDGGDAMSPDPTNLVDWDGPDDKENPRNWSLPAKLKVSSIIWINVFALNWASGADSQAVGLIAKDFNVSSQVELLSPALYVLGIAAGALTGGPFSEVLGRNLVYIGSRILHLGFMLGTALAANVQTHLVCRFLAGVGASTILAIHGASIADIFGPYARSLAWPFVACGSFYVAGGWITQAGSAGKLSWRWSEWTALAISTFTFIVTVLFLPETFAPVLLKWKAAALRKVTGDGRHLSKLDLQETLSKRMRIAFRRAWLMTIHEPIVALLGLWLIVVNVVLFGFLRGFTFLFQHTFKFSDGLKGTAFVAVALGVTLYVALSPLQQKRYKKRMDLWYISHARSSPLPPEGRLPMAFVVAFTLPLSMFGLAFSNHPWMSPWCSLGAVALFGYSWSGIYVAVYLYILDVYGIYAGSALASITCYRYVVSSATIVASETTYMRVGTVWVCMLLGMLATCLTPAPFLFYTYGARIRSKSRFAGHHTNDIAEDYIARPPLEEDGLEGKSVATNV